MAVKESWRVLRPYMPRGAIDAAAYCASRMHAARRRYQGVRERPLVRELDLEAIPAPFLRYRVDGSPDLRHFLDGGRRIAADIEAALGRSAAGSPRSARSSISAAAAAGSCVGPRAGGRPGGAPRHGHRCPGHRLVSGPSGGRPILDQRRPAPLAMPADHFDFIYAISVFTHLREDYQDAWLEELARVARPDGIVLLTVHGPSCGERLGRDFRRGARRRRLRLPRGRLGPGNLPAVVSGVLPDSRVHPRGRREKFQRPGAPPPRPRRQSGHRAPPGTSSGRGRAAGAAGRLAG